MPSAATTFTNTNNNSKEKRASVSSIGASSVVGGGVGGGGCNNGNASNGQHSSNTNLADSAKSVAATGVAPGSGSSQTDLTNNNNTNVNAKALKLSAVAANAATEPYNPMKQILVTIEHKIRNLEKRKVSAQNIRKKKIRHLTLQALPTIFIFVCGPLCFVCFFVVLFPPCARRFFATPCLLSHRVARPIRVAIN